MKTKQHNDLIFIAQQFFPELPNDSNIQVFGKGNINLSFLLDFKAQTFLLQRINPEVFPNADLIHQNIQKVYDHLSKTDPALALIRLIPTANGAPAWIDVEGAYWRLIPFVANSLSYPTAPRLNYAYDGAKMVGRFLKALEKLDPDLIQTTIPNFHNSLHRFQQFNEVIKSDPVQRRKKLEKEIAFIQAHAHIFDQIASAGLPLRVVHNDTKMDNILFDKNTGHCLGLIDWDTIMPGTLLSDYGDLVRTSINPIAEDSDELDRMIIDYELLQTLEEGFLFHTQDMLSQVEKDLLSLAPLWITLEQAMRFLTDYLMGDVYYKTEFAEHNLVRVRNQVSLFKGISESK